MAGYNGRTGILKINTKPMSSPNPLHAPTCCERWYFFAEANHPQNLYYQMIG